MNDANTEPELPRISRPIATLLPTALDRGVRERTTSIGVLLPFVGLLHTRSQLSAVSLDLPTLSYLITGGVGDVAGGAGTSATDPGRRGAEAPSPERSRPQDVRTVVRELVRVREIAPLRDRGPSPAAHETGRAGGGVGIGDIPATSGRSTTPSSGYPEWTVLDHGALGATRAAGRRVSDDPEGLPVIPHVSGGSRGPETVRATTRAPTVLRERSPLLLDPDSGAPSTTGTTATGAGETIQRPEPERTVRQATASDGPSERSSTATHWSEWGNGREARNGDAFGPPVDLTVRRRADGNGGHSVADGRRSSPVDLAAAGSRHDHPGTPESRPRQRTDQAGTTTSPLFDLSRAPPAEVDRFVDRLYGELTRRHRIERERRGR